MKIKLKQKFHIFKLKMIDFFHLLFRSSSSNYVRFQKCQKDQVSGKIICTITFNSYAALKKYQRKVRRTTLSVSSVISIILVSTLVIQLILPVFKSQAATYYFTQTGWDSSATPGEVITHPDNGSVTTFEAKDADLTSSSDGIYLTTSTDSWMQTTNTDFDSGVHSQTETFNGSVQLSEESEGIYYSSGVFVSSVFDTLGNKDFTTISWSETLNGETMEVKVRTDASLDMSGATDWSSCSAVSSGNDISSNSCVTDADRYVQYQVTLSTANTSQTPTFDEVTLSFNRIDPIDGTHQDTDFAGGSNSNTSTLQTAGSVELEAIANASNITVTDDTSNQADPGTQGGWAAGTFTSNTEQNGTVGDGASVILTSSGAVTTAQVAPGTHFSCALSEDGYVYCWGYNASGQLGNGTTTSSSVPVKVLAGEATGEDTDGTYLKNIDSISAGGHYACAVSNTGYLYCWGSNGWNQLGDGTTNDRLTPIKVKKGNSSTEDNDGTYLDNIKKMSLGDYFTCAVSNSGYVYCWGHNPYGIGDGTTDDKSTPSQVVAGGAASEDTNGSYLANIKSISTNGFYHTCVVSNDNSGNSVYCWGVNNNGELGDGTTTRSAIPVRVLAGEAVSEDTDGTYLNNISTINSSNRWNCAVSNGGNLYCWGDNTYGKLGDGTTTERHTPVKVLAGEAASGDTDGTYLTGIRGVSGGAKNYSHSCAISNNDNLYCWGYNASGQLGNGTTTDSSTPIRVLAGEAASGDTDGTYLNNLKDINTGLYHTCAVSNNNTGSNLYCWGDNAYGKIGDNTTTDRYTPVKTHGVDNVGYLTLSAITTYDTAGTYTGYLDAGSESEYNWNDFSWTGAYPTGDDSSQTFLSFKVKSADSATTPSFDTGTCDALNQSADSSILDLSSCTSSANRYLHYQVTFDGATDQTANPSLNSITATTTGVYQTSGTYTSSVQGPVTNDGFYTIDWAEDSNVLGDTDTQIKMRTCDDDACSSAGAIDESISKSWDTCPVISRSEKNSIDVSTTSCVTNGDSYVQYQVILSTTDSSVTPQLQSLDVDYLSYFTVSQTFTSSVFESASDNIVSGLTLTGVAGTSDSNTQAKAQIRTSADNFTWSNWCGPNNATCDGTEYFDFTSSLGSKTSVSADSPLYQGSDDQYFQYKITLSSSGGSTPTITQADVEYVVNAAPEVTNVAASQDSSGIINISYDLADSDNSSHTVYALADIGVTLNEELTSDDTTAITLSDASDLPSSGIIQIENEQISYTSKSGNDLTGTITRAVNGTTAASHSAATTIWFKGTTFTGDVGAGVSPGSGKTIAWTIKTDLDEAYYATARVRVSANDGNPANQIGNGDSDVTGFQLDTKDPVVNSFSIVSSTSESEKTNDGTEDLAIGTTEDNATNYQMRFSNDNATWSNWENYASLKSQWDITDSNYGGVPIDGTKTVYVQFQDANGNTASSSDTIEYDTTSPGIPQNGLAQDASNNLVTPTEERILFSWEANGDVDGDFAQYHLYRGSTDSSVDDSSSVSNWSEIDYANKTDNLVNYYLDDLGISESYRYYYRITTEDNLGNISDYSDVVSTVPDGTGGAGLEAPSISSLTVAEKGTTWVKITWSADEVSDSRVYYDSGSVSENSESVYVPTLISSSGTHEVIVTGLNADTEYNFLAKSVNTIDNSDTDTISTTTNSGATISSVNIPETANTTATVRWTVSSEPTSSTIYYTSTLDESNNPDFSSPSSQSATCNIDSCEAEITGLTVDTKYYFYVESDNDKDYNVERGVAKYFNFRTTNDQAAPVISVSGTPTGTPTVKTDTKAVVQWTTNEASKSRVLYKEADGSYNDPSWTENYNFSDFSVITDLSRNTTYTYKIQTKDINGNQSESSEYTFTTLAEQEDHADLTDPGDPGTSNVLYASDSEAVIKWNANTSTTAKICYSTNQISDMSSCDNEVLSNSGSVNHVFHLEDLQAETIYYYRIQTIDSVNTDISFNSSDSASIYFTTSSQGDADAPSLSMYSIVSTTPTSATVSVTSSENSIAFIEYLDTTTDFAIDRLEKSSSKQYDTTHTIGLKNLSQNTTYYFKVKLQDQEGNAQTYDNSGNYYTFSTTSGPEISSIVCASADNEITVSWTTDEDADGYVNYATSSSLANYFRKGTSDNKKSQSVKIKGLLPQTKYYYRVSSENSSGGVSTSGIKSCTTLGEGVDSLAPSITNVQAVFIGKNQVLANWITDESSTSQVEYGTTESYTEATDKNSDMVTDHNVLISDLEAGTTYHFRVKSSDSSGNEKVSDDYTFKTLSSATSEASIEEAISESYDAPSISSSGASVSQTDTSATISWNTSKEADSIVVYKPEGGVYKQEGIATEYVTSHEVELKNLLPNTKYTYYVKSTDSLGNTAESGTDTFTTHFTSNIFNVETVDINYSGATISWETAVNTTSQIEYGVDQNMEEKTDEDDDKAKAHAVRLENLDAGTKYYFRVKGIDSSANIYTSSQYSFQTPAPPEIRDFKVDSIDEHNIQVSFDTNVETDAFVTLTPQDSEEAEESTRSTGNPEYETEHTLSVENLESGVTYDLEIKIRDEEGNTTMETIDSYTTDKDENPPKINRLRTSTTLTQTGKVQTILTWVTDEPTDTVLIYRKGLRGAKKEIKIDEDYVNKHTAVMTTLEKGTAYYFNAKATDKSGNTSMTKDKAILTPKRKENIIQIIINNFQDIFSWAKTIQ